MQRGEKTELRAESDGVLGCFILVYFDFPYQPTMRASQRGHIHIFPTFMPSVFCFYFPSTCYSLSLEYSFPVMSFNLHIPQRSSKISPMPLNRYYFSSLAFFTYIHPHPNLRCITATSLLLHPQVSCSHVFRVQVPESFPLLLSPLSAATWPLFPLFTQFLSSRSPLVMFSPWAEHCSHNMW